MKKISLLVVIALLLSACSSATLDGAGKELEDAIANVADSENKYVQMVKGGHRADNPDLTYEDAFTAFFGTPRWKHFKGEDGQDVVEFTGDCTYRDVPVKARIQFVVDEEEGTFEATYLAFNEVPQDAFTLAAVIGKAFEEAEAVGAGSSLNGETDTSGQILFHGFTMQEMFKMSEDDIISAFGKPDEYTEGFIQYGEYDSAMWMDFLLQSSTEAYIDEFSGGAELFTFNGQSLEQEFDTLVDILGDGYISQGGTGYEWVFEWDIGDFAFIFYISRDDDTAYSITVHKLDGDTPIDDTPIDNDAYLGDDSGHEMYGNLDSDLYGRWRAQDGSLIEFSNNGVVLSANFRVWPNLLFFHDRVNPYYATWQASNGAITFTFCFTEDLAYKITTGKRYDHNAKQCQRRFEIVRKRRRNFVVFRRRGGQ